VKQWEIYLFPFKEELPHPAVILSNDERCTNKDFATVNALICTSVRLNRDAKPFEAILDQKDGLDWKTAVRCDVIYLLEKARFVERRGEVSLPRRKEIAKKLAFSLRLPSPW